jgi:hypothetical protein
VIANMVTPTPLDADELSKAAAGAVHFKVSGLRPRENQMLADEFALDAARTLQQSDRRETLFALGIPLVEVSFDAAGIDESALFNIAGQLADQMKEEVA